MVRKIMISLAAIAIAGVMSASMTADARGGGLGAGGGHGGGMGGGGGHGGGMGGGGGHGGGMAVGGGHGGGFHGGGFGGGVRSVGVGGGFRGAMVGGGVRSAMVGGGFRSAGVPGRFVGSRSFAFRPGFVPRANRFAFARFHRFHHRRFAFAAAPFIGVGLYGSSCWSWQPTAWGWQRVWACGYDYGYY